MKCSCKHEGQDKLHGNGRRVFNKTRQPKGSVDKYYRCTVCGAQKFREVAK